MYGDNLELYPVYELEDYDRKCGICNVYHGFTLEDVDYNPVFC